MNATLDYLNAVAAFHKGGGFARFLLEHGRDFAVDDRTFKGRRMQIKNCFGNSTRLVWNDPSLTYVEGYATAIIPIHHAWVMRPDGSIIDPTLRIKGRAGPAPRDYFGVPFSQKFLFEFIIKTGTYGLLDGMSQMSADLLTGKIDPSEFLAANAVEQAA